MEKIKFQWKTLKKAFSDLNQEKSGSIKPEELRSYLNHWGLYLTEDQFKRLFARFDVDGDGRISYEDFQLTAGSEIVPMEKLYFRQELDKAPKKTSCRHEFCWNSPSGFSDYCSVHLKIFKEQGTQILVRVAEKVQKSWTAFLSRVSSESQEEDSNLIQYSRLLRILDDYKAPLNQQEKDLFMQAFVANSDRTNVLVHIGRLYSIRAALQVRKLYERVDMYEEADNPDMVDNSGYLGLFYREKRQLLPIKEGELVEIISKNNRMHQIFRIIKDIDKDNNGYVTNQELDDIFKMNYESELGNRDLKPVFKKFASLQNRILIDYKKVKDFLT